MKFILMCLLIVNVSFGAEKILALCSNAKSELIDLSKNTTKGFAKDSMTIELIMRDDKVYVKSNTSESELHHIGGVNPQFLEDIASGHNVLYTYFVNAKILTIQKSYDLYGAVMVNIYLECQ